jgi:phage terminase small subunit
VRNYYTTDDIEPFSGQATRRLRPSKRLAGRAKVLFAQTVANCIPEHFRASDAPLLEAFCQASALAEQAVDEMAAHGAVVDDKQSPWFLIFQGAVKTMTTLALRLRISPQARALRASKKVAAPMSFYDEMSSGFDEEDGDEDGGETQPS